MNLKRCDKGHYYDADAYASCPHCKAQESSDTIAMVHPGIGNETPTMSLDPVGAQSSEPVTVKDTSVPEEGPTIANMVNTVSGSPVTDNFKNRPSDEGRTMAFFGTANSTYVEKDPCVGWLVCIKGSLFGQDFRLKAGRNFIGRDFSMDVCLNGEMTVSREKHAIIVYEPKQNLFLAMPGDGKGLMYLNGNVVLTPVQMKKNDILQVGEVYLMLCPFCDDTFTWKNADSFTEGL